LERRYYEEALDRADGKGFVSFLLFPVTVHLYDQPEPDISDGELYGAHDE
jgi:hypothetical protein